MKLTKYLSMLSVVALVGCQGEDFESLEKADVIDQAANLSRGDFEDKLIPEPNFNTEIKKKRPPLPRASEILLKPQKPKIGVNKTVSISVTEDVPLKDVFLELAKLADVDIEIDPAISSSGVIFKAKNKPFQDVIERLTSLAGLKYEVNKGILSIKQDIAYIASYPVNFLNVVRSSSGSIDVNANVLSAGEGGDSISTGSSNSISTSYDGDLWASVEANLQSIVSGESAVNLNRQAGLITANATAADHANIKAYIDSVKDFYSSQVLIEAKVVEVQLSDQFRSGIDWSKIGGLSSLGITAGYAGASVIPVGNSTNLTIGRGDLQGSIELAQVFGTTRTLSSPRLLALNNQQSVLTFARNEIFYDITIEKEDEEAEGGGEDISTITVESERQTIPIGIILTLQPLIDKSSNEIVMNVRPTVSRVTGERVVNPALPVQLAVLGDDVDLGTIDLDELLASASVPQVEVREMDTVLRLENGQIMAIGGMIEERAFNQDSGTPWLSEIPVIGNAFKSVDKEVNVVQTVIFLKATIVPGYGVDAEDQDFYNRFTNDPRRFDF